MRPKITNQEIAKALNICEQYVSYLRRSKTVGKKLKPLLIKFYESKIKELQEAINILSETKQND